MKSCWPFGWTLSIALAVAPVCSAAVPVGQSMEIPNPAFNYSARQQVVDRVLAQSHGVPAAWKEVSSLLEPIHADVIASGAGAPLDFLTNPEPSSVLVWGALFAGVLASGYAYRRRGESLEKTLETALA